MGIQIAGSAIGLPTPITLPDGRTPEWISNEDIFRMAMGENFVQVLESIGMRPEYPEEVVGLKHRRWTHPIGAPANHAEENCVDLGVRAVSALLEQLDLKPEDIDILLLASTTPHKTTTSSACAIGAALGIQAPCLDLKAGCSTGLYALLNAAMHVKAGFERVLLVASETPSKYANPKIQETVIGVGDAAVALLLTPGQADQGILGGFLGADGQLGQLVSTPGLLPPTHEAIEANQYYYHGNSAELKEVVPLRYLDAMAGALAQAGTSAADLDWYVPHQVNRSLTAGVAAQLGIPSEKQVHTLDRYASTAGASVLLALHTALSDGRIQPGQTLALNTVGGGLTWGALIWRS
ncbi:MAG: 3-oxoacyl-ACP synthase III family protein [Candidatus Sericytochromatia bacterium]